MLIFYGTTAYGQVDVVDKRFSVATEFFHVLYFPILPIGSRVVFDQQAPRRVLRQMGLLKPTDTPEGPDGPAPGEPSGQAEPPGDEDADEEQSRAGEGGEQAQPQPDEEIRIPISLSGKSVLLGYLRGWGFWLAVFCGFLGGMLWLMSRGGADPEAAGMYPNFLWTALIGFVAAMGSYYGPWNTASPRRAKKLCEAIGADPATLPEDLRRHLGE